MDKLDLQTPNFTDENIQKLSEIFPHCVTESSKGKSIDFDLLKQELSNHIVEGNKERYQLTWPGKAESLVTANTPINKTLRPYRDESKDFDKTENLFIEGDNLDALKLLQETYLGEVKMIYIDPPYNTGKDFVYKDNFTKNKAEYDEESGNKNEEGGRLVSNPDSNGRYHSDWLSMIYPRLKLARNLLHEKGVIFISIDDNEQANLKRVCDDVFGEDNFVNTISINMKNIAGASGGGEDKKLKKNIEYLLVYTKKYIEFPSFKNVYDYIAIDDVVNSYREEGKSWKYTSVLVYEGNKEYIGSAADGDGNEIKIFLREEPVIKSVNQVVNDEAISEAEVYAKYAARIFQTAMPQSSIRPRVMEKVSELGGNGDFYSIEYVPRSGKNKGRVYEQFYKGNSFRLLAWLGDVSEKIDGVLYKKELQGTFWNFVGETKNLSKEGSIQFSNGKKPVAMIKRLLSMQNDNNSIILDFFAGSASTAHAVMEQNIEDGGRRKYVLVQYPEEIESNTKENKEYLKYLERENIKPIVTEISKERIRRAGIRIKTDNAGNDDVNELDIGFRVLKVDSSNMKDVYYTPDKTSQGDILDLANNIKDERTDEDLLFQVLLSWGIDLSVKIERKEISGRTVYFADDDYLAACFENTLDEGFVKELIKCSPRKAVLRDSSFESSSIKINVEQLFKQADIEVKVI